MLKTATSAAAADGVGRAIAPPDLQTQFEALLDQVWRSEAEWRLYDRIDAFCAAEPDHCGASATKVPKRTGRSKPSWRRS